MHHPLHTHPTERPPPVLRTQVATVDTRRGGRSSGTSILSTTFRCARPSTSGLRAQARRSTPGRTRGPRTQAHFTTLPTTVPVAALVRDPARARVQSHRRDSHVGHHPISNRGCRARCSSCPISRTSCRTRPVLRRMTSGIPWATVRPCRISRHPPGDGAPRSGPATWRSIARELLSPRAWALAAAPATHHQGLRLTGHGPRPTGQGRNPGHHGERNNNSSSRPCFHLRAPAAWPRVGAGITCRPTTVV